MEEWVVWGRKRCGVSNVGKADETFSSDSGAASVRANFYTLLAGVEGLLQPRWGVLDSSWKMGWLQSWKDFVSSVGESLQA